MKTGQVMIVLFAAVFVAAFYGGGVTAQSMAMAPAPAATDCFNVLLNMSDCLTYVEKGSNLTVPEKPCCGELAGLVEGNPICLCHLLGNSDSFGIEIDLNKALKLPSVCGVETPPVSTCTLLGFPVGGPSPSESPISPGALSPGTGGSMAGGPSSGNNDGSDGISSMAGPYHLALLVGFVIAIISPFF